MFTLENRLRLAIASGNVPTRRGRTFLTGVTSVNMLNTNPPCIRFIGKKLLELKEVPFMQVFSLFLAQSYVLSNAGQFFKNNYVSTIKRFYNSFCNYVVSIGSETVLLLGNLLKVSFGRFAPTRLQSASDFLITLGNFFNLSTAKELVFRGDGNFLDSPVNAYNFAGGFGIGNVFAENYIQENFILSDKQFSGTSLPCKILLEIFRYGNRNPDSAFNSKQRKLVPVKPDIVTSGIIPDGRLFGLRASCFLFFLNSCFNCLDSFSCFHASRHSKLRGKIFSGSRIGFIVQRNSIGIAIIPTCLTYEVKRFRVSLNSWFDSFCRNIKFKFNRSYEFHVVHIINTVGAFVK